MLLSLKTSIVSTNDNRLRNEFTATKHQITNNYIYINTLQEIWLCNINNVILDNNEYNNAATSASSTCSH